MQRLQQADCGKSMLAQPIRTLAWGNQADCREQRVERTGPFEKLLDTQRADKRRQYEGEEDQSISPTAQREVIAMGNHRHRDRDDCNQDRHNRGDLEGIDEPAYVNRVLHGLEQVDRLQALEQNGVQRQHQKYTKECKQQDNGCGANDLQYPVPGVMRVTSLDSSCQSVQSVQSVQSFSR